MRFGLLYEHQIPRPWADGLELKLFQDALDQVERADALGFDYVWEVEHHFLEEYSHSAAPEVFLAACSQRTNRIRLGHGIVLMPPAYNHPARVAERIATLDLVSGGRVEFGTGESSSAAELGGFGLNVGEKRAAWREAVEECANMLAMSPYPGHAGVHFSMPARNVVPKPVQKPHPPLWVACSNRETIKLAASLGIGALTFAFVDPEEARHWVDDYYRIFKEQCIPIGHAVNPNICMVSSFGLHEDVEVARSRFLEGFRFFQFALGWHYGFGVHSPGQTDIWAEFQRAQQAQDQVAGPAEGGINNVAGAREHLRKFEACGVDQVAFIQQSGNNKHEHICEALDLFAREVMPEFQAREQERQARKAAELAPYVEAAFERKRAGAAPAARPVEPIIALGRQIAER